jgi:SOS-response transcriptional repressor LexA
MIGLCERCGQPVGFHREPLTRRQRQVYDFIVRFNRDFGYAPTLEQVAQNMVREVSTIHEHVNNLRSKGWLVPAEKNMAFTLIPMDVG